MTEICSIYSHMLIIFQCWLDLLGYNYYTYGSKNSNNKLMSQKWWAVCLKISLLELLSVHVHGILLMICTLGY